MSSNIKDSLMGTMLALFCSLLINLPLWHTLAVTDEWKRPSIAIESGDEEFYLTRIKEAADGLPWLGHPYVFEERNQRYPLGNFWEALMGSAMRASGISIKTVSIVSDALLPLLLVWILWMATRPLLPERKWRVTLIAILFLGFELSLWKRPISPQATFILPLLYFWGFFHPKKYSLLFSIIRGGLIGIMTLSYPFHWTYCLVAEALFHCYNLYSFSNKKDALQSALLSGISFFITAIPYIVLSVSIRSNPLYGEVLYRLGLISRHLPAGIPLQLDLFLIGGVLLFLQKKRIMQMPQSTLLIILLGAGIIVLNQMLLTGKEAEFSSHYRQILFFPLWISIVAAMRAILGKRTIIVHVGLAVILIVIGVRTEQTLVQAKEHLYLQALDTTRLEMETLMNILSTVPDESVVFTDVSMADRLTVYTSHYPYWASGTHMYMISQEELYKRARVYRSVTGEDIPVRSVLGSTHLNKALYAKTVCILQHPFSKDICNNTPAAFLPDEWNTFKEEKFMEPTDIMAALKQGKVSYIALKNVPLWLQVETEHLAYAGSYELRRFIEP